MSHQAPDILSKPTVTVVELSGIATETTIEKPNIEDLEQGSCLDTDPVTEVKRDLKQRHIAMMALGGTIGTGLFIGTQKALSDAGPLGSLLAYGFMASVVYSIAQSVGEMTTFIPITGSFAVFVSRFLSPALGAAVGWLYWFSWATTFAIEVSVISQTIMVWYDGIPIYIWITFFLIALTCTNFLPVRFYGEIEFGSACIKVVALLSWLIYAFVMVMGGGKNGFIGMRYWKDPGMFGPGILVKDIKFGQFLGILSALVNAAFTFQGVELVGVSAGEASNPGKAIPRAINRTFFRILVFYMGSIFFLGLLIPFNHDLLNLKGDSSPLYSPFVIAIINSGTSVLPHIFNAVILITIISAGNSNVYVGSRLLYAIGTAGLGPKFLTKTNRAGVPYFGVLGTAVMGLFSFMAVSEGAAIFAWLLNIGAVAGLICWVCISICHLRFIQALKYNKIDRNTVLPFVAKGGVWYIWYAVVCLILVTILQGFPAYFDFSVYRFMTTHISLFIFFFLWGLFQVLLKTPTFVKLHDVDVLTGSKLENGGSQIVEESICKKDMTKWEKILDKLF